jgi:hypothetical protein
VIAGNKFDEGHPPLRMAFLHWAIFCLESAGAMNRHPFVYFLAGRVIMKLCATGGDLARKISEMPGELCWRRSR